LKKTGNSSAAIDPPAWLNADAKAEWFRVLASGFKPAAGVDHSVLAVYCQSFARWVQAEKILEEYGTEVIIRDDKGVVKSAGASPQIGISRGALDRMLKAAGQLGLRANLARAAGGEHAARTETAAASDWFQ
jgi:P27 family predicted phage terminase small subunit